VVPGRVILESLATGEQIEVAIDEIDEPAPVAGTLTLAGVPARDAVSATLLYRLVAYWLRIPEGAVAYVLFRRRYEVWGA
jgi:hypothetical protein